MFDINEILFKLFNHIPLTKEEKFRLLNYKRVNPQVVEYIINKTSQIYFEILGKYEGMFFDLMVDGKFEGWCWQTTETLIMFFNDTDYIERGYLYFDERTPNYYHSWICFTYNNVEYVLDSCLRILCKKTDYHKIFKVQVKGYVSSISVLNSLIKHIEINKQKVVTEDDNKYNSFWKKFLSESAYMEYLERTKDEIVIEDLENPSAPFYRNASGYKAEISNEKIKKLTVHYYYGAC